MTQNLRYKVDRPCCFFSEMAFVGSGMNPPMITRCIPEVIYPGYIVKSSGQSV